MYISKRWEPMMEIDKALYIYILIKPFNISNVIFVD